MKFKIADDFSPVPSGRFPEDGPDSGERFREEVLLPAIRAGGVIEIDIDDTAGYGSSFLEEAFGGAVRKGYITKEAFLKTLVIASSDPEFAIYVELIRKFIMDAKP